MSRFYVGDVVQLTIESIEFYENDPDGKYRWLSIEDWDIIDGPLVVKEIIFDGITFLNDEREPIGSGALYAFEELDKSFYEFELEPTY